MPEEQSTETQLVLMNERWKQCANQVQLLSTQIATCDGKLDDLLLREAHDAGATAATRRLAGYVSAIVSMIISGISLLVASLFV
jgi:hypothetical protein